MIKELRQFRGIGPKHARNIPMDRHHPAFRWHIAIDSRITSVSEALGIANLSYRDAERYHLGVAKAAGIDGWTLDRLLYKFTENVLEALGARDAQRARQVPVATFRRSQRTASPRRGRRGTARSR